MALNDIQKDKSFTIFSNPLSVLAWDGQPLDAVMWWLFSEHFHINLSSHLGSAGRMIALSSSWRFDTVNRPPENCWDLTIIFCISPSKPAPYILPLSDSSMQRERWMLGDWYCWAAALDILPASRSSDTTIPSGNLHQWSPQSYWRDTCRFDSSQDDKEILEILSHPSRLIGETWESSDSPVLLGMTRGASLQASTWRSTSASSSTSAI